MRRTGEGTTTAAWATSASRIFFTTLVVSTLIFSGSLAGAVLRAALAAEAEPRPLTKNPLTKNPLAGKLAEAMTGAAEPRSPSNALYAQALRSLEAADLDAAERLFEQAIQADPHGPRAQDARRHLGQIYTSRPATPPQAAPPFAPEMTTAPTRSSPPSDVDDNSPVQRPAMATTSDEQRFLTEAGDRVFFSAGSAELGGRARVVLSAQAAWLVKHALWHVVIEGHADDPPLNADDLDALSEARALAVRERLIAEGVGAGRVSIVPWGRHAPISDCPDTSCQAQNRRAVSVLTTKRGTGQSNSGQDNKVQSNSGQDKKVQSNSGQDSKGQVNGVPQVSPLAPLQPGGPLTAARSGSAAR